MAGKHRRLINTQRFLFNFLVTGLLIFQMATTKTVSAVFPGNVDVFWNFLNSPKKIYKFVSGVELISTDDDFNVGSNFNIVQERLIREYSWDSLDTNSRSLSWSLTTSGLIENTYPEETEGFQISVRLEPLTENNETIVFWTVRVSRNATDEHWLNISNTLQDFLGDIRYNIIKEDRSDPTASVLKRHRSDDY